MKNTIQRREFVKISGGLTFLISSGLGYQLLNPKHAPDISTIPVNSWVKINTDGTVIIYNPAIEMGQGSMTALPVIVAEEMNADWSKVKIEYSPIDASIYGHDGWGFRQMMAIVGSYAVEGFYDNLRMAGAQVRKSLLIMAADLWKINQDELHSESGFIYHEQSGRKIGYGELAQQGSLPNQLPEISSADFKKQADYGIIGKFVPRRDIPSKVDGTAKYSIDINLPEMAYGVVERASVEGSKPDLNNRKEIESLPGVLKVVELDHGIGIIAEKIEQAFNAKERLDISWSTTENSNYDSQAEMAKYASILEDDTVEVKPIHEVGDVDQKNGQPKTYQADFFNHYVYHAPMEPVNAVVRYSSANRKAEVWIGTQSPDSVLRDAAKFLELEESEVTVHRCYLGGGFGRKTKRDYLKEACDLAKQINRPVKLIWKREDDIRNGYFRAASLQRIKAKVDSEGNISTWEYVVTGHGKIFLHTGAKIPFYDIPNQKILAKYIDHGVKVSSWRAESHGHNKFAIEAFLDEVAEGQNIDPLKLRQNLLKGNPRALNVVNSVAKLCNWGTNAPEGRARGISFCERNSITATVVEISLDDRTGKINVHKVWFSLDAGLVIQPNNAKAQIEGGIVMALSSCLLESITFKNGSVEQSNFHDYHLLRCADAPEEIEIDLISSSEKPTGIGEASIPGIGGAIASAFAKLTGKRLYRMPFSKEYVLSVLSS